MFACASCFLPCAQQFLCTPNVTARSTAPKEKAATACAACARRPAWENTRSNAAVQMPAALLREPCAMELPPFLFANCCRWQQSYCLAS
ncbi:hypothetical protein GUJ93_ZPchr0012g18854 [Zizania palustris]|uniref:Uncharacterized protein n=1 Tax=Zizania palustris TaxID=103762 RepID=A0A8J5WUG5_ZIZPA|nr:hypothetical protein GUJ93_ZPchr0012g18854 [Zizania palustris]